MMSEPDTFRRGSATGRAITQAIRSGASLFLAGKGPFRNDGPKSRARWCGDRHASPEHLARWQAPSASLAAAMRSRILRECRRSAMTGVYEQFISGPMPRAPPSRPTCPGFEIEVDGGARR